MKNETIKYEKEIDSLLEELCRKDWMSVQFSTSAQIAQNPC